jgi:arsenate reductase
LGLSVADIIRTDEQAFNTQMLDWPEQQQIDAIIQQPILMQRPIVVANGQARIGRPPEAVLEII